MKRICVLLITLALVAGMLGCPADTEPTPPVEYSLSISTSEGGQVTTPGEGTFTYGEGEVVDLAAEADEGYRFVDWAGDVDGIADAQDAATAIAMNGNYTIVARFEKIPEDISEETPDETPTIDYVLTLDSTDGGEVTVPGEGAFTFDAGTMVDLLAQSDEGYQFVNWTGDVGTIGDVNSGTTTITVNDSYSITANFEVIPPVQYSLTVTSTNGGSVTTPNEGTSAYGAGSVVNLAANPTSGYYFVSWTGDVGTIADVNAASTTITMNGNYSIVASFSLIPVTYYTLTVAVSGSGSTSPGVGQHIYPEGTVVGITATPAGGWQFVMWTGSVGNVANVNAALTTITMNGNHSISASFQEVAPVQQYNLTIENPPTGGWVTTPGDGSFTYDAGAVVQLEATPISYHRFLNWTGDVDTIADVNAASTTITMNGDYLIMPNFWAVFDLTVSSSTGGSVTTPGEGVFSYDTGTVVNLVASPASGYRFVDWSGDVATISDVNAASTTITVENNYSITANFVARYTLFISSSSGGSVTTPGEGTFAFVYDAGTVVDLVASPDILHQFDVWRGDVDTIADVKAATTTITMNGNYHITAYFMRRPFG